MSFQPANEAVASPAGSIVPWQVGDLVPPPVLDWRHWAELIGPGVLVAGSAVGAGEWLFGPAVTAQYGGTFLWLATFSIVLQVVYNLEVMRYALYCGEPIFIGFFRTRPGPRFWLFCYMTLFLAHIWPFMASNAAVPLASAMIGHLPGNGFVRVAGFTVSETRLVRVLGYVVFYIAFVPLIFGGKIASMLERLMVVKLVVVFGFLLFVESVDPATRNSVSVEGSIRSDQTWQPTRVSITQGLDTHVFERPEDAPSPYSERIHAWVANQGFERVGLLDFWWRHGRLPDVDWSLLAAFAAIAGAGGLSNALFSNYARDKGWGMGAKVGAIPSAIGGRSISLSHVGMVFPITPTTLNNLDLEQIAASGVHEFCFVFSPLRLKGATGSPGNPIAIR